MEKEIERSLKEINNYLEECLKPTGGMAKRLEKAMNYSVFPGGKRIRPLLVMAIAKLVGLNPKRILPVACGIELIHCFSLVHDDLPCMDNDDYRRGKLTCHRKFGQAEAILAGDALLCLGIREIAKCGKVEAVIKTCDALGSNGMAGGQSLDMIYKERKVSQRTKNWIDRKKTGELFSICFEIPAIVKGCREKEKGMLKEIGILFGQSFQILDDLLDREGNEEILKTKLAVKVRNLMHISEKSGKKSNMLCSLIKMIFGKFVDR
ncbi:MAG: polyprenyl synthetase family protein [Candidatus Omnitrophica bacterium]|nr:polyprenyl synthetase family protein [Candidatus Omnitrophota bacterium]